MGVLPTHTTFGFLVMLVLLYAFRHERKQRAETPLEPRTGQCERDQGQQAEIEHEETSEPLEHSRRWNLNARWVFEWELQHHVAPSLDNERDATTCSGWCATAQCVLAIGPLFGGLGGKGCVGVTSTSASR